MALALRLRRSLSLIKPRLLPPIFSSSFPQSPLPTPFPALSRLQNPVFRSQSLTRALSFRSSAHLSDRRSDYGGGGGGEERKISPDEILFEGCDYNHWLITMEFPQDPKPTPEEMVETYVQTLAKVVGSVEEAKKRMYACSTTTYTGFQAVMTEEMSEKFRGLPGVVFILPDSYLYPETKEYGGDKYDNGVITPRPPPVHYGRQTRPRNQNRFDRPNYNNRPPPNNYGENYNTQQNYAQPGQDGRGFSQPGERGDFGQGERRGPMPNYQGGFNQGAQNKFAPQEQRNFSQGQGGDFRPGGSYGQGDYRQGPPHGYNADYRQGPPSGPGYNSQGGGGYNADYRRGPPPGPGYNSQGGGVSSNYGGGNVQGGPGYGGDNRQGAGFEHEQNNAGPVEGQPGSWQGMR